MGEKKSGRCVRKKYFSWRSQELAKIVQKSFFAPAQLEFVD